MSPNFIHHQLSSPFVPYKNISTHLFLSHVLISYWTAAHSSAPPNPTIHLLPALYKAAKMSNQQQKPPL
jgi:hypothetical protein